MEYLHPAGGVVGGRHSPRAKPRDERRSPANRVFDSAKPVKQRFEADMVGQGRIRRFETVPHREFSTAPPLAGPFWLGPGRDSDPSPGPAATPDDYATFARARRRRRALGLKAGGRGPIGTVHVSDRHPLENSRTLRLPPPLVDRTVRIGPGGGREVAEGCPCP